jgi:large subunit ribosomal protein L17
MRHLRKGRKLGRISSQRKALFRTMLGSLVVREKITTTEAKAKEVKSKIDRIINKAKKVSDDKQKIVVISRELKRYIPETAIKKLMGEFIVKFKDRNSGYARIIKLPRRKTDGSKVAIVEFV